MSGRPGQLASNHQVQLGALVAELRLAGTGWKALERRFKTSRVQLWRYVQLHLADQDETTKSKMKHPGGCNPPLAA